MTERNFEEPPWLADGTAQLANALDETLAAAVGLSMEIGANVCFIASPAYARAPAFAMVWVTMWRIRSCEEVRAPRRFRCLGCCFGR